MGLCELCFGVLILIKNWTKIELDKNQNQKNYGNQLKWKWKSMNNRIK